MHEILPHSLPPKCIYIHVYAYSIPVPVTAETESVAIYPLTFLYNAKYAAITFKLSIHHDDDSP